MATIPDYQKYPCCGYEHKWLPGISKWVSTGPSNCYANSCEQLDDARVALTGNDRRWTSYDIERMMTMPYDEYVSKKRANKNPSRDR